MKFLSKILCLFLLFSIIGACGDDDDGNPNCDNSNSPFQLLYNDLVANNYNDSRFMDTEIHEYTFVLSSNVEICQFGYQSQIEIASNPYNIRILDSVGMEIYSEDHVFSALNTSYRAPNQNVTLNAGVSYTIQRIQEDWDGNIGNTIGRMVRQSNMEFPYTQGILTITASNFHQNGGPAPDFGVPFIDMIFEE